MFPQALKSSWLSTTGWLKPHVLKAIKHVKCTLSLWNGLSKTNKASCLTCYLTHVFSTSALDIQVTHKNCFNRTHTPNRAWIMESSQSEMNILSNGKSHDLGEDVGVPLKTMLDGDQWVFFPYEWLPLFNTAWSKYFLRFPFCLSLVILVWKPQSHNPIKQYYFKFKCHC